MSQNAGTLNPSRGNRRFVVLAIVLGLMGAGFVYVATSRDTTSTATQSPALQPVPVVVAKVVVPARTRLTQDMLDVKLLQPDAISPGAFANVDAAVGQITRYPLTAGEQVLTAKVVNVSGPQGASLSFVIPEGMRGFSITASEVQNAGGLVIPGDYVDVILLHDFAIPGSEEVQPAYLAQTLMQNVEVLAVSQAVVNVVEVPASRQVPVEGEAVAGEGGVAPADAIAGQGATAEEEAAEGSTQRVRNAETAPIPGAATITVAVTPEDAHRLYLAEANGRIRLSVRPFGDDEVTDVPFQVATDLLPEGVPSPR